MYRYSIHNLEESSAKLGNCDICGKPCTEVFYQVEERQYKLPAIIAETRGTTHGWTQHKCQDHMGHESCLIKARREGYQWSRPRI